MGDLLKLSDLSSEPSAADVEEHMDGLPPWMKFTALIGVPSAIALFLTYVMTTAYLNNMEKLANAIIVHQADTAAEIRDMKGFRDASIRNDAEVRRLIRVICLNGANTDAKRWACDYDYGR